VKAELQPDSLPLSREEAERFLRHEARLLDAGRFRDWLALFAEHGVYWIPSVPGQTDANAVPSIVYEDVALLNLRLTRLEHPQVYAARPLPRTAHLIGNVELGETRGAPHDAPHEWEVGSSLFVAEYREPSKRIFTGHCTHVLRRQADGLKIVLKRYDLIDCDGVHDLISVPM
jgi:3-phenylpropionate/cinnamic acid dioxygenase small subunit